MNCDEFRAAVLGGDEDELTAVHEAGCVTCRLRASDLRTAFGAMSSPAVWEEPARELGGQVGALIGVAAGRGNDEAVLVDRSEHKWLVAVGIAAAVVLLVGLFALNRSPAPDWEVALPGTDLAPNATGTVQGWNEASGTRMVVAIEGLAPAPNGFVYELWLSSGPIHVSAGTFHSGGEIELWSGVTRADYPRLWITLESVDEDESPSGETVLGTERENT